MVDLQERLEGYQVTSLPRRPPLRLLWSPAADGGDDGATGMHDCSARSLAILVPYRITQVPVRAASRRLAAAPDGPGPVGSTTRPGPTSAANRSSAEARPA